MPGQKLKFVMKAPDNLMPVSTSEGVKLVSANAAYSDDEQESALAAEHRQVCLLASMHVSQSRSEQAAVFFHHLSLLYDAVNELLQYTKCCLCQIDVHRMFACMPFAVTTQATVSHYPSEACASSTSC